ncbi:hypothetical protein [Xanthomonas phage BUDD]|nr:hypothetical protein [Xanthomonas phage BUDD]
MEKTAQHVLSEIDWSTVSIGCPIPGGARPWTQEDRDRLEEAMKQIIAREAEMRARGEIE